MAKPENLNCPFKDVCTADMCNICQHNKVNMTKNYFKPVKPEEKASPQPVDFTTEVVKTLMTDPKVIETVAGVISTGLSKFLRRK